MTPSMLLGAVILGLLLIGMYAICGKALGWATATGIFIIAIAVTALIAMSVALLTGELTF